MPRFVLRMTTATGPQPDQEVEGDDALETLSEILREIVGERPKVNGRPMAFRPPILVSIEEAGD